MIHFIGSLNPIEIEMTSSIRLVLLLLGLALGANALAQKSTPVATATAGAVIAEKRGSVRIQVGAEPPQYHQMGKPLLPGTTVDTGPNSSAVIVYPDGTICVMGEQSKFRIVRYHYDPNDLSKSEEWLNLISGSLRIMMGEIAQFNPDAVRVQVGVVTVGVDASILPGTDASAVAQSGAVAVTVQDGRVVAYLPSGQPQQLSAGQGMYLSEDGVLRSDTTAHLLQLLGQFAQGQDMQQQLADLTGYNQKIVQTIITMAAVTSALKGDSTLDEATAQKTAAAEILKQLESLPPPGTINQPPPPSAPAVGVAGTPATGGGGGGLPCAASCN
ncbi:MAG TPA: FecR domain-containing protein [Burkholderiales bacterium]|nr:FecR domain-containing protein [Burkholderiales bacterium]